jgi:exodeoxyribonuclease VII large subunit
MYGIENAKSKLNITLEDVIVQGNNCPKNICDKLIEITNNNIIYDMVIITRGGGSFQDLFGFSQPELIETLYNFNLPTLSAIGHMIDNPLSDLVASYSAPTPSLAAQFIVDYNTNYVKELNNIASEINNNYTMFLVKELERYNKLIKRLSILWNNFEKENKQKLLSELNNNLILLNQMENKLSIYESSNIILNGKNNILTFNDFKNYKDKTLEIVWNNVVMKVSIDSIRVI